MTKVYVPYAGDRFMQETAAAAPADAVFVDVSGDVTNYWSAFCEWWAASVASGEDLVVIEHDVVSRPDVIEQFESCDCLWATFPYHNVCHRECQEAWRNQLGLTRFRAELIAACPDALSSIHAGWSPYLQLRRVYRNLCDEIA